jgi:hypothetical protein
MQHTLPNLAALSGFSPDSRLWVYTCDRPLTPAETATIQQQLDQFCRQWTAHNHALKAVAEVFEHQFVLLMVDETQAGASGCSIDKSVHFLEDLGAAMQVDFFERKLFAWINTSGQFQFSRPEAMAAAVRNQEIADDTLMVNTMVLSKRDFTEKWLLPFNKSWHRRIAAPYLNNPTKIGG